MQTIDIPIRELVSIPFHTRYAKFHIKTAAGTVYMRTSSDRHDEENDVVVMVDAEKFLALWRKHPNELFRSFAMGDPDVWRRDYKFAEAADGFLNNHTNPVPLIDVECVSRANGSWVGFNNGVTRTIYLLANGCKCFPVESRFSSGAQDLFDLAGASGTSIETIASLVSVRST
ncbi:plasmid fertility inhibition factor family protein [Noviherbaspirillum pedocola]|uniref:Uncharacterized protein n=1 Tax=Noviherbaspirillum pedocola TaxID=2801341 RepID=A0A934SY44_9BURK|nr:hypothetical protein [Noviherbaspirillum pedocola]MBK4737809.1 hypothetical protein [Noviherbaspirillum pedocola]